MPKIVCSLRFWSFAIVAISVLLSASLPALMSSLLRHMFTAPGQKPWPGGSLRLIDCHGLPAQALYSADRIDELREPGKFRRRNQDVWIVSYVKSGTTWTIGILAALWNHPAAKYAGSIQKMTRRFCPQPELPDLGWGDDGFGHSLEELNDWQDPRRCFKSHWPSPLSSDDEESLPPGKYIYVMRNAQDQMKSHWNQIWGMGFHYGTQDVDFMEGWGAYVQDWLDGNVEMGKWMDHVAGWYQRSLDDPDTVLIVRYEDLKKRTDATIRQIASFLDFPVDEKVMARVRDLTGFERMKAADENDPGLKFMRWLGVLRRHHIRQGEISGSPHNGDDELKLSEKHKRMMEHEYESKLQTLGMPRDWIFLEGQ